MKHFLLLFLSPFIIINLNGQTFLNGSFENNISAQCEINTITNAQFDSLMYDVRGIGLTETIDLFYQPGCLAYGPANDGNYFVSVENNFSDSTQSTIISLKLSDTIQAGQTYNFCYYDKNLFVGYGPVAIGISGNDSTFGTHVYTSPAVDTVWTQRAVSFVAPHAGCYITVKYGGLNGGVFIDNFSLCKTSDITETGDANSFSVSPNPSAGNFVVNTNTVVNGMIEVFNAGGQLVCSETLNNESRKEIRLENCAAGIYFVRVWDGKTWASRKLMVE